MNGTALVLSGGGAKGAYEIGVWKALLELNITDDITAVSGTSIGALNAALFVNGDYTKAEELWLTITKEKVFRPGFTKFFRCIFSWITNSFIKRKLLSSGLLCFCDFGIFSLDMLDKIIEENLDLDKISKSKTDLFVTCTQVPMIKPVYFRLNQQTPADIKDMLMASAAIPVIFDDIDINDNHYFDGGLVDNTPIKPLYELGYKNFIVVPLSNKSVIKKSKYPDCNIIEIISSKRYGGFFKGTLNFSPNLSNQIIELGYKDALKLLKQVKTLQ